MPFIRLSGDGDEWIPNISNVFCSFKDPPVEIFHLIVQSYRSCNQNLPVEAGSSLHSFNCPFLFMIFCSHRLLFSKFICSDNYEFFERSVSEHSIRVSDERVFLLFD